MATWISPQAAVDPRAEIGDDVFIGPFCVVGPRCRIGNGTHLENNVTLMGRVTMGVDNMVYPGTVIGGEPQDIKKCVSETEVVIGDRNLFREAVTVNRGSEKEEGITKLGNDNFLMAAAHVGHDCIVGNHCILTNACLLGGHVHIRDRVVLGGAVAVHQFSTVYEYAFVGGVAAIRRDIPPFMTAAGHPSTTNGVNKVGLQRNGFDDETIRDLSSAARLLFRKKAGFEQARQELEAKGPLAPEVEYLFDCVEQSQSGKFGRARDGENRFKKDQCEDIQWRKAA